MGECWCSGRAARGSGRGGVSLRGPRLRPMRASGRIDGNDVSGYLWISYGGSAPWRVRRFWGGVLFFVIGPWSVVSCGVLGTLVSGEHGELLWSWGRGASG